jgi:hypothetical protein
MPTKLKILICTEDGELLSKVVLLSTREPVAFSNDVEDYLTRRFESEEE